jgi:hypothetical protein
MDVVPSAHSDVAASFSDGSRARGPEPDDRAGRVAERKVEAIVRAALPAADGFRVFANVSWTGRTKPHGGGPACPAGPRG